MHKGLQEMEGEAGEMSKGLEEQGKDRRSKDQKDRHGAGEEGGQDNLDKERQIISSFLFPPSLYSDL